ncbi:MAG: hypothetical protein Q8M22_15835 [Actinomycetota bacterium]|nr:hypothetical protein [Actinomycetota bacterium]
MPACVLPDAVGELAASRHGAISRRLAAEYLNPMAIARLCHRGVFLEPAPGVLVVAGSPATYEQRVMVATLTNAGRNIAIGGCAARLHDVDGFADHPDVFVASPRGSRVLLADATATQRRELYPPADVTTIQHIACTSLARTVVDLARCHPDRYERAADDFQRRGHNLIWLQHTMERVPRQRGDGLDMAFADLAARMTGGRVRGSWFEQLVEECLASPRIPPIERQYEIRSASGAFVARPDLAVPSLRLGIEAHSRKHHTGPRQEAFDERRDNRAAEHGWYISYVGWADTRTPASVRRSIERIVARRASDLGLDLRELCRPLARGSFSSRMP